MSHHPPGARPDPRPDVDVVIVSYESRELLARCLETVLVEAGRQGSGVRVHVVDNASADGTAEMVAARFPTVRLVSAPSNLGYAGAANTILGALLAEPANGDEAGQRFVLVLNPDTELGRGSLHALAAALALDPSAAVAGPALVYPDGTFQHSAFRFPGVVQIFLDLFPIPRLMDSAANGRYPRERYLSGRPFPVDFPLGACLMVRLSAVRRVGLMDDGYFMYSEEIDWCRRFRDAGFRSLCVPEAVVVHHAGATTRRYRQDMLAALWSSRLRYQARHGSPVRRALVGGAARLLIRLRIAADSLLVAGRRMDASDARVRRLALSEALARQSRASIAGAPGP